MDQELSYFKENIDSWIKQINSEVSELAVLPQVIEEHTSNIEHNYEVLRQMQDEIERLKEEIITLKILQVATLKQRITA